MLPTEQVVPTLLTVSLAFSLVLYAYVKRRLTIVAFLGTTALGVLILLFLGLRAGYAGLLVLLTFFLLGTLTTRYKYEKKVLLGVAEGNKGTRDLHNVLGNGLSPLIFAALYAASSQAYHTLFLLGFTGAVATACADTFSTEIGQAEGKPRLITTFERVPVGTNGGVSLPGFGAALLGSFAIALASLIFIGSSLSDEQRLSLFLICLVSGFLGCVADSYLGATVENRNPLYLNKHHVNFLATLSGGAIAVLLGSSLGARVY
jgi:uncharacterized protein (TIGR00297 family)